MEDQIIALWPEGPPSVIAGVAAESFFTPPPRLPAGQMLRNISEPTLTVVRPHPAKVNGRGVVICPGGGWRILAWQHEGLDVAEWFAARGFTAFLLKYRVMGTPSEPEKFEALMTAMGDSLAAALPAAQAPRAMAEITKDEPNYVQARDIAAEDGRRAIEIVRSRAAEWDVDPGQVGMIGFSAGAFLTMDVAIDPRAAPLAFVAAIYGGETRGRAVPADAPPLFATIAQDDRLLFRVVEGLYADWSNADRPSALHVFSRGAHGFGMVRQGAPSDRWLDLLDDWLNDLKR
ncbi:hypothetical protein sos41_34210 [Alphaproteobacteria bacterium SO-S41]|nr:hypothetical protein sos41_34210 [Alphaproteobacteria bacterium SO-S41]